MSLKHFRWNKVFPPLDKEKVKKSVGKSVKETGIEIVIVLVIILAFWIYRWYASTNPETLSSNISGALASETVDESSSGTTTAAGSLLPSSAVTHPSSEVSADPNEPSWGNVATVQQVTVSSSLYADALAIDLTTLGEDDWAVALNNNQPYFLTESDFVEPNPDDPESLVFEYYSPLDSLGRCGTAYACISSALMPSAGAARGDISSIKPSGWNQLAMSDISGGYLYNRSHLIAWALAGEDDNPMNLITGTYDFNHSGMLYCCEDPVFSYMDSYPDAHVLYRVTPVFEGDNLVAGGVVIEAWSIEDNGGLCFCYFVPNLQPGYTIDYATGVATAN